MLKFKVQLKKTLTPSGDLNDIKRLRHILCYLKEELLLALQDGGVDAFIRMYDDGKKLQKSHILVPFLGPCQYE